MKVNLYLFGLVLVLALSLGFFANEYFKQRASIDRLQDNRKQEQQYYLDSISSVLQLTYKEARDTDFKRMDSLFKASGINKKRVQQVTNIYHKYYNTDTTIIVSKKSGKDTNKYDWKDDTKCFSVKGYVQLDSLKAPKVGIISRKYINNDSYVLYWEWEKTKFLKIPKWWKGNRGKIQKIHVNSECGESLVRQIDIKKN